MSDRKRSGKKPSGPVFKSLRSGGPPNGGDPKAVSSKHNYWRLIPPSPRRAGK
jgi:hypothetical protein